MRDPSDFHRRFFLFGQMELKMIEANRPAVNTALPTRISSETNIRRFDELRNGLPNEQLQQHAQFSLNISFQFDFCRSATSNN
jgi:hypothetical protein